MRRPLLVLGLVLVAGTLLIALTAGFYLEENWRGAQAWRETEIRLRNEGEPTDWRALLPAPVPDAQNLAALPLFAVAPDPKMANALEPLVLKNALKNLLSGPDYPYNKLRAMQEEKTADFAAIQEFLSKRYRQFFSPASNALPIRPLGELDALCPALTELRDAAAARPFCRFNLDDTSQPAFARPLGPITELIQLGQALNLHALVALHSGQPDVALGDIETVLKIDAGVRHEPLLVSGLVANGLIFIQMSSVWEGLTLHSWNDAQLVRLQADFAEIDFLADEQLCLRGEALGQFSSIMDYLRDHSISPVEELFSSRRDPRNYPPSILSWLFWAEPRGWLTLEKNVGVTLYYRAAREDVDPAAHRVFPEKADRLEALGRNLTPLLPWNFFPRVILPPALGSAETLSYGQFRVDAIRIACLLERYRLVHGTYPDSLDDVSSYAPADMPRDLINGEPYHYRHHPDDTFLLYSVGWNQTDDGGKVAYKDASHTLDNKHGDWVWPVARK